MSKLCMKLTIKQNCLSFQVKERKKFERLLFTVPGYLIYQSYKALKILKIKAKVLTRNNEIN